MKICEGLGPLQGFVNANYAGDLDTRRSTTGYLFYVYGGPVSWRSILQSIMALSTIEAKYIRITEAAKKALWLRRLIDELGVEQSKVTLFSDSQYYIVGTESSLSCAHKAYRREVP